MTTSVDSLDLDAISIATEETIVTVGDAIVSAGSTIATTLADPEKAIFPVDVDNAHPLEKQAVLKMKQQKDAQKKAEEGYRRAQLLKASARVPEKFIFPVDVKDAHPLEKRAVLYEIEQRKAREARKRAQMIKALTTIITNPEDLIFPVKTDTQTQQARRKKKRNSMRLSLNNSSRRERQLSRRLFMESRCSDHYSDYSVDSYTYAGGGRQKKGSMKKIFKKMSFRRKKRDTLSKRMEDVCACE